MYITTLILVLTFCHTTMANTSECSTLVAKICVLFDRSKSIPEAYYNATRNNLIRLTKRLNVDRRHVIRFGIYGYEKSVSDVVNVIMNSEVQIPLAVESINNKNIYDESALTSGTSTSFALRFVKSLFDQTANEQSNAPKIVILISDGLFNDLAAIDTYVAALRADNVDLFTIREASHQVNYDNLKKVSTEQNLIHFSDLFKRVNQVSIAKCNANVFRYVQNYIENF